MKEFLTHVSNMSLKKVLIIFTSLLLITSCGGSGNKAPKYSISASQTSVSFSNELLQPNNDTVAITVNFQGPGILLGYAPDAQPAAWLNFTTKDVTENSATIELKLVNADRIIPQLYQTTLRLSTGDPATPELTHVDIDVSLLVWQLDTDKSLLSFGGVFGDTTVDSQTIALTGEGTQWQASFDVDWLSVDKTEGTGDDTLTVSADLSSFTAAGLYEGHLILTEVTTGDTKQIPVELGLDQRYFSVDHPSIALVATPEQSKLSQTVHIGQTSADAIPWQATSSVDWLTLTADNNQQTLNIAVDLTKAPKNSFSTAEIAISAQVDATGTIPEIVADTIYVGFYHSDQATNPVTISNVTANNNNSGSITTSPFAPYIFVASSNQLKVYHQYTGALITSLTIAPETTLLENLVMHPNGQLLLAQADEQVTDADGNTTTSTHYYQITIADLANITVTELADVDIEFDPLAIKRFSGRYKVITQILEIADLSLKQQFIDRENAFFTQGIDQANTTGALYALDFDTSTQQSHIKRFNATVNDLTTQKVTLSLSHDYTPTSFADSTTTEILTHLVVTDDEQSVFVQHNNQALEWVQFDGSNFTDNGLLAADDTAITLDLIKSSTAEPWYIRFYSQLGFFAEHYQSEGQQLSSTNLPPIQPNVNMLSADERLVISYVAQLDSLLLTPVTP
jgi:hypothetical protein